MTTPLDVEGLKRLLRERIGQDFDGECHLTEAEALSLLARVDEVEGENRRLQTEVLNAAFSDRLDMEAGGSPLTWKEIALSAEAALVSLKGEVLEKVEPFAECAALIPASVEDFKVVAHMPGGEHAKAYRKANEMMTAGHFRALSSLYDKLSSIEEASVAETAASVASDLTAGETSCQSDVLGREYPREAARTWAPELERWAENQRSKTSDHHDARLYRYENTELYQWWSRVGASVFAEPFGEPFVIARRRLPSARGEL